MTEYPSVLISTSIQKEKKTRPVHDALAVSVNQSSSGLHGWVTTLDSQWTGPSKPMAPQVRGPLTQLVAMGQSVFFLPLRRQIANASSCARPSCRPCCLGSRGPVKKANSTPRPLPLLLFLLSSRIRSFPSQLGFADDDRGAPHLGAGQGRQRAGGHPHLRPLPEVLLPRPRRAHLPQAKVLSLSLYPTSLSATSICSWNRVVLAAWTLLPVQTARS
jgi:hypothetical protein